MKRRHKLEITAMGILLICAILLATFFSTHQFTSHEVRVKNFFAEEKNNIDVVAIGASEIYTGFSPEYIWKNYGITSYNLATAGAPMGLAKSQVEAAIDTQNPELIVISMNGAVYNNERASDEGFTRMWLDNMPESEIRSRAIDDLIKGDKSSYKFKLLKYHDNVSRFVECFQLFKREIKAKFDKRLLTIYGIQGEATTDDRDLSKIVPAPEKRKALESITEKQLYELLDYLKESKIKNVIFVNMPRYYDKVMFGSKERINTAMDIVKSYGFEVYDFDKDVDKIGLDPKEDFYNYGHLNMFGQQKMSKYFYENIVPKYNVKGSYDDDTKERWDENYEAYTKVFAWVSKNIKNNPQYKLPYNYREVEHILDGTIDEYEKSLIKKAEIRTKVKEEKKDERNKKRNSD